MQINSNSSAVSPSHRVANNSSINNNLENITMNKLTLDEIAASVSNARGEQKNAVRASNSFARKLARLHGDITPMNSNLTNLITINNNTEANDLKEVFDNNFIKQTNSNNLVIKTIKTKDSVIAALIDYKAETLTVKTAYGETIYNTRNYVVLTFDKDGERVCGIYSANQVLRVVESVIAKMTKPTQLTSLIDELTSKVFVDRSEQAIARHNAYYGRRKAVENIQDQQLIIETHKVSAVGIESLGKGYNFCSTEFNGSEIAAVSEFFVGLGEPVVTDKNNKKYFIYGNGCRAAGVDLVNGHLVTLNPIPREDGQIANGAKILNRIASHGFLKADQAAVLIDGEENAMAYSNLQFALSGGVTCGAGVEMPVFVSFGGFGLNNGVLETNAAKDVKFAFEQVKNLSPIKVSLYSFDEEYRASLGATPEQQVETLKVEIANFILEWCKSNKELKANQVIKFNGVRVLANPFHFNVAIDDVRNIKVKLGGHDFNGQIRSVVVETKATVISVKKSPKVRGLTKKATAFPTNTVITKDGVPQDWTAILNRETIKGSAAVLDIIANDDEFIESQVVWNKGVLTIDGKTWTQDELVEWLNNKAETYAIRRQIAKVVADELKDLKGIEIVEENGVLYVLETVRGFFGYSVFEVEVSTADENHGISYLGLNEQQILALAGKEVSEGLDKLAAKQLSNADLLIGSKEIPVFKLPMDFEALRSFMDIKAEFRTKAWMGAMAKKSLHGIRVEWESPKQDGSIHTWAANLPFGIFLRYGSWDVAGNPATNIAPVMNEDKEVVTNNIIDDVFDFINVITDVNVEDEERKSLFLRSNIFTTWVEGLRTAKRANSFTKAGIAFHQKVVGDLTIGNVAIGTDILPVVKVHPNNPMVKNAELNKAVKAGEAVVRNNALGTLVQNRLAFLSRCPLPLFTAVIVKFDESLDDSVIAVNPVVWIKSNLGDFDGDLGYLTDSAQFNFAKPKQGAEFNAKYSALFNSKEGSVAIEDALSVKDGVIGADKANSLLSSWVELDNKVSKESFTNLAISVHNHYKYSVGKLYNIASALTQELGNEAYGGKDLTEDRVAALIDSWFLYEETGLGGWTIKNETTIKELGAEVKAVLNHKEINKIRHDGEALELDIVELAMAAFFTGNAVGVLGLAGGAIKPSRRRGAASAAKKAESKFNPLVIGAAVNTVLGRRIQNGSESMGYKRAVITHATRVIARKEISEGEAKIFEAANEVGLEGCRFAKQIEVIAALRSQCQR